jgi:site-specific DNA-cytosine methylase
LKEYCRLQTVPENYFTNIVSESQAKKMIGNGWTVDVIAHIFSFLKID